MGDVFDIAQVKNEKGYWDWTAATPATAIKEVPADVGGAKTASSAGKSTYETSEERAARQRLIVRQSSLSNAVDILTVGAKTLSVEQVLDLAEQLTDWVFEKQVPLTGADALIAMDSDLPD